MILVTGPNGNVGTELVRALIRRGDLPFRIAANTPAKIDALYGPDAPRVRFSFDDRTTWGPALDGATALFLLFPLPHPRTAKSWMVPFVEAAVKAGVQHIVYVSVPGADTTKMVPHYTVERAVEGSGVGYTILRSAFFSQNLCRDITTHAVDIARDNEILVPAGKGKTSFIDSRDVAEVAVAALADPQAHARQAYVLTGPEVLDYHEVAARFTAILGRRIVYRERSFPRFWRTLWPRVTWDTLFFMTGVYFLTRIGKNAPMTDTLPRLLDRAPRRIDDFIADYRDKFEGAAAMESVKVATPGLFKSTAR